MGQALSSRPGFFQGLNLLLKWGQRQQMPAVQPPVTPRPLPPVVATAIAQAEQKTKDEFLPVKVDLTGREFKLNAWSLNTLQGAVAVKVHNRYRTEGEGPWEPLYIWVTPEGKTYCEDLSGSRIVLYLDPGPDQQLVFMPKSQ